MAIPRGDFKPAKKARTMRGKCLFCSKMILPGDYYYENVGGTNILPCGLAHEHCYAGRTTQKGKEEK